MLLKVRRQGAVRATSALIAVGVNEAGYREIVGVRIANWETEQGWLETFRWLKSRGLEGVDLMVSDAHEGLVEALHRYFQGASWQRYQPHFPCNVHDKTPAARNQAMAKTLDRMLEAGTPEEARRAFQGLADRLEGDADRAPRDAGAGAGGRHRRAPAARQVPAAAPDYKRPGAAYPGVRRRKNVIRILANNASTHWLLGAYLAETHEEWITGRRYFRMDDYFGWRA